ncbi:MAG TPA: hypothetical protein VFK43_22560 [Acidimicrobiales bacterium]|nr:hypothetical protein [Acidimicrobiales bacterium]
MGSLRNPVGPLPSTIYWRRRAVMLAVLGVLALLIAWAVTSGGGNGKNNAGEPNGKNPAPSITPGPSGSGPAISQAPGGRDESGDESSSGGDGSGSGTGSGSGGDGGSGAAAGGTSDDGKGGGGSASGEQVPAGSGLPNCTATAVKLSVRSVRNAYAPGTDPTFELIARNSSGSDCKLDLGPDNTVVTITAAGADDAFWSSDDCHETAGSLLFRVPAGDQVTYTVQWNRDPSAPNCATPSAGSAKAGTYLVEAKAPGLAKDRTSFVLEKD